MRVYEANFKFSGEELRLIKAYTGKADPNDALEDFITDCIGLGITPENGLVMIKNGKME